MKRTHILLLLAATLAAGACTIEPLAEHTQVPIRLTTDIALTRAIATPTQETQLVSGQTVYVWANREATSGTADWTQGAYLKAWELTSDGAGALAGSSQYYPEGTLSMVALHGNFSFAEGVDAYPGTVVHSVLADQSTVANFAKSDLLWWRALGQGPAASKSVAFAHNLSKIEIHLVANSDYDADALNDATVVLRNIVPTVSLDLEDGSISAAYGTPITVTPRKTGKVDFEAIIPPQQKPLDFIEVSLHGTVIHVDAQVSEFDGNTRYPYDLSLTHKDVRKNPLWYVAEYNVNYDGANYSWATSPDEGYYFSWKDAMNAFTTKGNANAASPNSISGYYIDSGGKFSGWHLPSQAEWWSISPGGDLTNIWTFDSSGTGTYKASNQTVVFGYNPDTQAGIPEASYWKTISSTELHALRFLGTEYCSAWKYVWTGNGMTVYATLVGTIDNTSAAAASWYTNHWNDVYFGNDPAIGAVSRSFGISGFSGTGSGTTADSLPASVYHWSATSQNANDAYVLVFASGFSYADSVNDRKAYGRRIRLFRTGTKAKTTIETSSTSDLKIGDIVCSDGYIFNANDAVYVKQEGRTAIGIIAFVNDGTAIGNAATESGLGRYTTKSKGRALVLCAKNIGNSGYGTQDGTDYLANNVAMTDAKYYKGYARTYSKRDAAGTCHKMCYNYTALPAPQNSTGWFLPSAGQWKKILIHLGGVSNPSAGIWYDNTAASYTTYTTNLNNKFSVLTATGTTFSTFAGGYQTCTEYNASYMTYVWFNSSQGICIVTGTRATGDGNNLNCRPVLAF